MCQGLFPDGKKAGAWSWPLTSIQRRGKEWMELYLSSPSPHAFVPCTTTVLTLFGFERNWAREYVSCLSPCVSLSAADTLSAAEVGHWNRQADGCSCPAMLFVLIQMWLLLLLAGCFICSPKPCCGWGQVQTNWHYDGLFSDSFLLSVPVHHVPYSHRLTVSMDGSLNNCSHD